MCLFYIHIVTQSLTHSHTLLLFLFLLQSGEALELKISEMKPCLIDIGTSLEQALNYQRQHDDAIRKIEVN